MAKIDTENLMTPAEAARQLGISRQSVHQAIRERRLASVQIAGKPFIPIEAVRTYIPNQDHIDLGRGKRRAKKGTNNK